MKSGDCVKRKEPEIEGAATEKDKHKDVLIIELLLDHLCVA